MNNDPIPDFILNNQNDYSNGVNTFGWWPSNDPIPDFIKDQSEEILPKRNLKDEEVKTQLGVDFDNSFSSDSKQVKEYVDSLSDDDYELRDQWREEWYSLDARKALMDNRELVNSEQWNLKYKINTKDLWNRALNYIKNLNEWYEEIIHPWYKSAQEWLDEATMYMEEKLNKENLMNQRIDKNDPYTKLWSQAEWAINNYETFVNLVQIPKVLWQTLTYTSSKILNILDQMQNLQASIPAEVVDFYQKLRGKDPIFNIQYDEERSNPLGSYIQFIKDWLWAWFVISYPVATYLMSLLGSTNQDIQNIQEKFYNKWKGLFQYLLGLDWAQNLIEIAWLNAKDEESLVEGLTDWLFLIGWALAPKLFKNRTVELHKEAFKQANEFAKKYGKYKMTEWFAAKEAAWRLPEWTEILNKKWKSIAVSTPEWWRFTTRWALETWLQGAKWYAEMFKNYWTWFYKNYNKWLDIRNPYTPVWELPNVIGTETQTWKPTKVSEWEKVEEEVKNELTPEREAEISEKWFYADESPIVKTPKKVTTKWVSPKESWVSIWEFIKKNINKITGKKGWLNKDLANKLQTSKDLQNEYVNTIDPYIRENWTNNPWWVIQEPLNSLVESVKDKIIERKVNNQIFRRWQKQYKVEITEEERNNQKIEDEKIKKLLKALEKQSDSPEELLKYLLNLPKWTVEEFNKMIPDFSQNLSLIKDTLDITKAITSSDLLDKFLKFKSTRWTRNKHFIRKYIYKKLREAYEKAWIKRNMYEIEEMINQLSEEQLIELEEAMVDDNIPAYMKEDFLNNLYDKLNKDPIEAVEWKKIGNTTIQLSKNKRDEIIEDELTKQWYRREEDTTPVYKTEEELRQHILPDWTTIWEWMDRVKAHLSPKAFRDLRLSEADFWNKAINYNQKGLDMSSFVAWHEIAHFVLGKLTTSELFDLVERIRQLTKDSWKEVNRVWMWEYLADTISNYLNHGNIDWLKNLLTENLEWPKKEITEHIKNLLENFKKDKLFQSRAPRYESARNQWWITAWERMDFLRKVDPNLKDYSYDLDVNSPTFSEMKFNINDWKSLSWDEWKDTLSHDQYLKLYSSEDLFNLEKEIKNQSKKSNSWRDDIKKEINEAEAYFWEKKYEKYQKAVKNIDPDIIWLTEKDWQIYVKYLIESNWERYELPNRPWYVEVKEVPAKDYFTEEELNQLPKELKNQILDNEEKDIIQLQKDLDYWHHRAMKAERWSEDPDDYLDLENRKYDENADIEQVQKDIDYRHHRAMVAERGGE